MNTTAFDPAYVADLQKLVAVQLQLRELADARIDQLERIERGHEAVIYTLLYGIGRHFNGDDWPLHKAIDAACTAMSFSDYLPPKERA
jgi:hypothetical protein